MSIGWTIVIPVKSTTIGKSRIAVAEQDRQQLALALAIDTVTAVASAGVEVLVIADDAADAELLSAIAGVRVQLASVRSLNGAIAEALTSVTGYVGVLPGDLPRVTGTGLRSALTAALPRLGRHPMAVVADRQGVGTTLLVAATPADLRPLYGPDSFSRHLAAGAVELRVDADSGLRDDVDTIADLNGITAGHTGAVWAGLCCAPSMGT